MKNIALLFTALLIPTFVSIVAAEEPLNVEQVITNLESLKGKTEWQPNYRVITSYSIHYTKLYEARFRCASWYDSHSEKTA